MMTRNKQSGRVSFWDLLIVALFGVLGYLLYLRGHLDKYLPEHYASHAILGTPGQTAAPEAPSTRKAAPPAPGLEAHAAPNSPVPAPINDAPGASSDGSPEPPTRAPESTQISLPPKASAEPTPPMRIDLATLNRRYWPRTVKLRRGMELPIIMNGKQVGSMQAPVGMELAVVEIHAREVIVKNGDGLQKIAAGDTDLLERVHGIMKVMNSAAGR